LLQSPLQVSAALLRSHYRGELRDGDQRGSRQPEDGRPSRLCSRLSLPRARAPVQALRWAAVNTKIRMMLNATIYRPSCHSTKQLEAHEETASCARRSNTIRHGESVSVLLRRALDAEWAAARDALARAHDENGQRCEFAELGEQVGQAARARARPRAVPRRRGVKREPLGAGTKEVRGGDERGVGGGNWRAGRRG
jgi:hypothetical protein